MDILYTLPLLQIHITAVFATLALVIISDLHGALWMYGKFATLPEKRMELLHKAVWASLIITMSAGFVMFTSYPAYLLSLPAFQLKLLFIAFLLINAFVIGKHVKLATTHTFKELPRKEKVILIVSGLVSTSGWVGAYTCAQFLS